MSSKKIGFIGCGNIASAIIGGAISAGYIKHENLYIFDTDSTKTNVFTEGGATLCGSSTELVSVCDYVFLTVKPQIYDCVLSEIATVSNGKCFISVAAGITVGFVKSYLGENASVIRVMPNTPLMVGKGAVAMCHYPSVSKEDFSFIKDMFACSGVIATVSEELINIVTAISGSAPAYVLRFAKNLIDFAVANGMTEEDAKSLVLATVGGSAELARLSADSVDTLIRNVTSPNGTTYAGLCSMDATDFDKSVNDCLEATRIRAEELTK